MHGDPPQKQRALPHRADEHTLPWPGRGRAGSSAPVPHCPRSQVGTWAADLYVPAGQGASATAELALATPAAGAAVGALARLPLPAALKFLRQMRPGVAQAALAALQACALLRVWMHSYNISCMCPAAHMMMYSLEIYRGLNALNPQP